MISLRESKERLNTLIEWGNYCHRRTIKALEDIPTGKTKWSQKALKNYGTEARMLVQHVDDIFALFSQACIGISLPQEHNKGYYPFPEILTITSAKKYVANLWDVEIDDIDIILSMKKNEIIEKKENK